MKKLLFIFLFCLISTNAYPAAQQIGCMTVNDTTTATEYTSIFGNNGSTWTNSAGRVDRQQVIPKENVSMKRISCRASILPGVGISATLTVEVNTVDSACAVTIDNSGVLNSADCNVPLARGDLINMQHTDTGTSATKYDCCVLFENSDDKIFYTSLHTGGGGSTGNRLCIDTGSKGNCGSTSSDTHEQKSVNPVAGTMSEIYFAREVAPGTGNTYSMTWQLSGSSTALAVTLGATDTTVSLTGQSVAVSEGNISQLLQSTTGTPSATQNLKVGLVFTPTTAGQFPIINTSDNTQLSASATEYGAVQGGGFNPTATETDGSAPSPLAFTVKKIFVNLPDGSPGGAGKSYDFTFRKNLADTALTTQISVDETSDSFASDITVVTGSRMAHSVVPAGTPTTRYASISLQGDTGSAPPATRRIWLIQ